jgi:glutathione S-transferase
MRAQAVVLRAMLTFFDAPVSANTYKVRLLLKQLALPHEVVRLDLLKGEARAAAYRERNPFGRVPFIDEDGFGLAESNAILLYLSRGSKLLPADPRNQALVTQWMFFEQNQVEISIGIPRFLGIQKIEAKEVVQHYHAQAKYGLGVLERHLATRLWLVNETYTIADIALYAYTHLAPAAGHDLLRYPAISQWLERFRAQPGWFAQE